jgi:uncharacterized membrane protein YccC
MTDPSSTTTASVVSSPRLEVVPHRAEASLSRSARTLADAARAFREASDAGHDRADLAVSYRLVEAALDDLAAAAELAAYSTMEGSRRRRAGAADGLALAKARAVSWRLHRLRRELVGGRRICSDLRRVLGEASGDGA